MKYGACVGGELVALPRPEGMVPRPDLGIVLDPRGFSMPAGYEPPPNARPASEVMTVPLWPAPRHQNGWRGAKTLTKRGRGDLGTVVRFATSTTTGPKDGYVNPEFVEWIMGYPPGWTLSPQPARKAPKQTEAPKPTEG